MNTCSNFGGRRKVIGIPQGTRPFLLLESSEHGTYFYQYDIIDEHDIYATSCKQQ
jgi:hypothetical protein